MLMSHAQRLWNFLYNEDRAIASLAGAPPQETISSETGRLHDSAAWAQALCAVLNTIEPNHCQHAEAHAAALDAADQPFSKGD